MDKIKLKSKRYIKTKMILNHNGLLPEHLENQRKNFNPEKEPKLIPYNKNLWELIFPNKSGINLSDYQLTNIGVYSVINKKDSNIISKTIKSYFPKNEKLTITDATSNMGGMVMVFGDHFDKVNAVEIVPYHCKVLEHNLSIYHPDKMNKTINIHCMDYLDVATKLNQDIVFFDPPWGGKDYINKSQIMDLYLDEIPIEKIVRLLLEKGVKLVVIRVPRNYNFVKIFSLAYQVKIDTFINQIKKKVSYFTLYISKNDLIDKHIKGL